MEKQLPFFNWSLRKALDTEPDSFGKARISIICTVLLFSVLKATIAVGFAMANDQWRQELRAIIALSIYFVLTKVLLYKPSTLKFLAHFMLFSGVLIIWSNIFIYTHKVNLPTLQFVFTIALSSFYTLGSRQGVIYSITGIIPVLIAVIFPASLAGPVPNGAQELASPGFEIIVILNFVTLIVIHYLFFEAFRLHITEKEKLNQRLQESVAAAHKLAESRANFLSTMSHELRTPLNSVIGMSELLLEDDPQERQKENLKILQFSALDLLSLINNVLDFNKIDSDKLVLEKVTFRLADYMRNICSGLTIKAADKNLEFVLDIDEQLKRTNIISDPTRLSQLMYNLVSNAIKFTDKGSVTVKLECVRKTAKEVDVLFSITDTGIGIHPDRHGSVFELFTQAETHITRSYGGTGLGLAIVKQVLVLFGSNIQLESSPGKGSRFFFTIPFVTDTEVVTAELPFPTHKPDVSHLKIMIAEDNEFNRLIIRKQLQLANLEALIVEDGRQAYDACLAGDFDAIFMDLNMPVMDGYETVKAIRALPDPEKANIYVIAFTASVTEQESILGSGFNDFLYKPINLNDLSDKLEKIVMQKRSREKAGTPAEA